MKIKSIQHLVSETLNPSRKRTQNLKYTIRKLQRKEIKRIKELTGINVQGYSYVIDRYAILHTIKEHGNAKTEAKRGQIAVTTDVFTLIPQILNTPDKVEVKGKDAKGSFLIEHQKEIDGKIFYIQEIRGSKSKEIALKTIYIQQKKKD